MANYTLTYSERAKGFPSFYSYYPEFIVGMNNYLYSFSGGQLYRHNTNDTHNEYYGATTSSMIKTVINESPLDNKLFKTLNLEATDAWDVSLLTDVGSQTSTITSTSFVKKEGDWFSYVRNDGVDASGSNLTESDYKSRATGGIGEALAVSGGPTYSIEFKITVDLSSKVCVGDFIYAATEGDTEARYVGQILTITPQYEAVPHSVTLTVDSSVGSGVAPLVDDFILYAKNTTAESMGVLGHYVEVTLTLPTSVTSSSELFAIESEVMKSYP